MDNNVPPPRVLVFPLPAQGHVTPMLNLAELLSLSGLHVTFLITDHAHARLLRHGGAVALQNRRGFAFLTFPDGLAEDNPRTTDKMGDLIISLNSTAPPLLKQILASESVTCVIADGIFGNFVVDVAGEAQIQAILFRTSSASYFWTCFSLHDLIQARELPIIDMDKPITRVAGMESFLRCRDLPSFCRVGDTSDPLLRFMTDVTRQSSRADSVILNTFEDLEGPIVSQIRDHCNPRVYTVGPLHALLEERKESSRRTCTSMFHVDRACMTWLDSQPPKSVIYVSFGSSTLMSREQLMEFWHGLVSSKKRFLWAIRPDLLSGGEGPVPCEGASGFVAEWVPQEEVLNHGAVGGFLTHSGWNSSMESVVAGVPMICWPCFADQQVNSRVVGHVWRVGIDLKDVCDRRVIEKTVNDLMAERRREFAASTAEIAGLAKMSVSQGGSSYSTFDRLIQDIKLMTK